MCESGMLLGTRLWYPFYPSAIATEADFEKNIDNLLREVGDRGKPKLKEGIPPDPASVSSVTARPAPVVAAPEPAPTPLREPTPAPHLAAAPASHPDAPSTVAPVPRPAPAPTASCTPSTQVTSLTAQVQPSAQAMNSSTSMAMMDILRELRAEAKAEVTDLRAEARSETAALQLKVVELEAQLMAEKDVKLQPEEPAISADQLTALQARLEALHVAKLLSVEELHALEDTVADYFDLVATMKVVMTMDIVNTQRVATQVLKMVVLSEGVVSDSAFARQCRRKFC